MSIIHRLLALSIFVSGAAHADRFFVEPTKGSGVDEADREAVEELVRMSVPQSGSHVAVSKKDEADYTLQPGIMKLGGAYILSIRKLNKTNQTVFSEKMKAASMDEMDNIAGRLTRAVITNTSISNTADVTNITREEETMNSRRYHATRQWVVGLGPGWSSNLKSSGGGFSFLLGYEWGLDPDFSVSLNWLINSGPKNDGSSYNAFSLGGDYYFSRSKYSPFVGAKLGYGSATVNDNSCTLIVGCSDKRASGWAGTLSAGYKVFRTSTVNAAVLLNYSQIFDQTKFGSPGLTALLFAVYW